QRTLRDLFAERRRGLVPDFEHVIIETSGLADPAPLLQLLATDRSLGDIFSLSGVLTVVDAVNAERNSVSPEWRRQIAVADRIVISKRDLTGPTTVPDLQAWL